MAEGEPNEVYVDVGGGAPSEDVSAAAHPAGEGVPAQPVVEPQGGGPMEPGHLAVDVGGGEPVAMPPPVLTALMQQMQILADGQQALAGHIDALDNDQGPQQAQQQLPPQPQLGCLPVGGALAGGG